MVKKTFKELNKFSQTVRELYERSKNVPETKLGYAIKRFEEKNLTEPYREYNIELGGVRIDHALTEKATGALLKQKDDARGFQYDKAGLKAVIVAEQAIEKEWAVKEFEVEPYICKELPEGLVLTDGEIEVFTGLVLE